MRQALLGETSRASRVVDKYCLLAFTDTKVNMVPIGFWISRSQMLGLRVCSSIVAKGLEVKYFLQIRQNRDEVVAMRIPSGVGGFDIQDACFWINVRIVHVGGELNFGMCINIIVFFRQSDLEFKNPIRERSSSDKNNTIEMPQIVKGGDQINTAGSMLFEMFVFNCYFVVAEGLLAFLLRRNFPCNDAIERKRATVSGIILLSKSTVHTFSTRGDGGDLVLGHCHRISIESKF